MKRKIKMLLGLCLSMIVILSSVMPAMAVQVEAFSDVPVGHWAYQSINNMVRLGVIAGYPDSTFKPDKFVSREEFAKILCGATSNPLKEPGSNTFLDIPKDYWAFKYVETVKDYLTGYPSNNGGKPLFKGTQDATREDVAVALVKIKGFDKTVSPSPTILDDMYKDVYSVSSNLKNLIAIAVEKKLITGYPDGTIRGTQTVTRAEAAVLIDRANSIAGDVKVSSPSSSSTKTVTEEGDNSLNSIEVTFNKNAGKPGEKIQATATAKYSDDKTKNVTNEVNWKSLNESILSVNGNGQITLLKEGTAKVKATFEGKTDEEIITVYNSSTTKTKTLESLSFPTEKKSIKVGEKYNLQVIAEYSDDSKKDITNQVTWLTSSDKIAKISVTGEVYGVKEGVAIISAQKDLKSCYIEIVVNK